MKKLFIIVIIFIIQSYPSFGEWREVIRGEKGDTFYIDFERIRKIDGYIYYWTLVNYKNKHKNGSWSETNY